MVLNPGKGYYFLIDDHHERHKINLNGTEIASSNNDSSIINMSQNVYHATERRKNIRAEIR